jgi:hypothetical protein
MIDSIQYTCKGNEVNDGINTELYFPAASGMVIIDTLVHGKSLQLDVDNTTGYVLVNKVLQRGDLVQIICKTLPRNSSTVIVGGSLVDFIDEDFEAADFT